MWARTVAATLGAAAALGIGLVAPEASAFDLFDFDPFGNVGDFYTNGPDAPELVGRLACRGTLSFGDGLARAVRMTVDTERREITTPDCRKYPHLARFCAGELIRIGDHRFVFGGAESPTNTKLWADLYRSSKLLTIAENGTDVEIMRVLFTGYCTPAGRHHARHARRARDP
jgi:hypothetical protein